jgi:hypothetical protein
MLHGFKERHPLPGSRITGEIPVHPSAISQGELEGSSFHHGSLDGKAGGLPVNLVTTQQNFRAIVPLTPGVDTGQRLKLVGEG